MAGLQLNTSQQEAVDHGPGPCLVIAGAGSGKTRVLTERIQRLVKSGVPPWSILGFTFTNKAAGEMRKRLEENLGPVASRLWLGTFHSIGVRILRREWQALGIPQDFTIYDADDQLSLLKRIIKGLALPEGSLTPQGARSLVEKYKSALVDPVKAGEHAEGFREAQAARIYKEYQRGLSQAQALDFTDLIALPVRLFDSNKHVRKSWAKRFEYVLVDEFQDTNPLQMRFIQHLSSATGNLFVVGDDDQSIYGWRGADIRHILDFETHFPGTVLIRLEQNYRSTKPILAVANAVISNNTHRKGKELWTDREEGQKVRVVSVLDEEEEAEVIARRIKSQAAMGSKLRDFAVLYRTHAQSRAVEASLGRYRLPYQIIGGTRFYDRKEVRDLLAYLKVIANPSDTVSLQRILNVPTRGIGKTSEARLIDLAERRRLAPGVVLTAYAEILDEDLPASAARKMREFGRLLLDISAAPATDPAPQVLEKLLDKVPYVDYLQGSDPVQAQVRRENVEELLSAAQSFYEARLSETAKGGNGSNGDMDRLGQPGSLLDFLTDVALVADIDKMEARADTITLMTLHNAKGLEYETVFLCGVEEQLLPHAMSCDDEGEIEEERRLFYVGVTRAESRLWILHAMNRRRFGDTLSCAPSRFLEELPEEWIEREGQEVLATATLGTYGGWGARSTYADKSRGYGKTSNRNGVSSYSPSSDSAPTQPRSPIANRAPRINKAVQVLKPKSNEFSQVSGFDDDVSQEDGGFRVGMRVRHASLGDGVIHKLEGGGDKLRVIVMFDGVGARKLLARVAGLQPI
ncbi:MAG: UvrD-helicase domain-containing protein [bacterium]|nr:UvrD-helicase domain-containing protein [bacterium]